MDEPKHNQWIPLGAGLAFRFGVGNKAAFLDKAAKKGLPVPRGVILLNRFLDRALKEKWVALTDNGVEVRDADQLYRELALPPEFDGKKLAVRSAFSGEDGSMRSEAGRFHSELNVPTGDPQVFCAALAAVWNSGISEASGGFRRDVLLMEMVAAEKAGVAFSETEFEDDLLNYADGLADELLAGKQDGRRLKLPKLRRWERRVKPAPEENWRQAAQKMLRDARKHFGALNWDIEWAWDGEQCYLLQIRPVTGMTMRNEFFTIANHKEILPELPSQFMSSLIASCARQLFGYYRKFDSELPARRPFIEVFYGRPYINLSLLTEMARKWGLPTRLITDSIGGKSDAEFPLNIGRLIRAAPALLRMARAQRAAPRSADRAIAKIDKATRDLKGLRFAELIQVAQFVYISLVTEMFSLTAAMSGPMAILRKLGALDAHHQNAETISTRIYTDLLPLKAYLDEKPELKPMLEQGVMPDDRRFFTMWASYLERHGHRGVYESDLARPRYREAQQLLMQTLLSLQPKPKKKKSGGGLAYWLTIPVWRQARASLRKREELRYHAMIAFERLRLAFLNMAEFARWEAMLPNKDDIWKLRLEELARLDRGWTPDEAFWTRRNAEIEDLKAYRLPDLFRRYDDLESCRADQQASNGARASILRGLSLTRGSVEGRAWLLDEPSATLPEGFVPETTVLVARSVDAGWIPSFAQAAGVVVETGGDLSHGSIILREMGLPAITNAHDATRVVRQGDPVRLDAAKGALYLA